MYGSNATIEIEHGSGWVEEEIKRAKFNFTFEDLEGQDKFSSGESALKRVDGAFPHIARDRDLSLVVLQGVGLQLVNISLPCQDVNFHCIL